MTDLYHTATSAQDLKRIKALPRRILTPELSEAYQQACVASFRLPDWPCDCAVKFGEGNCINALKPIQAQSLIEGAQQSGLLAPIGVGHGKTGLDVLLPMAMESKVTVLFVPSQVKPQFLTKDLPMWAQHFKVPNLAGARYFTPGRPVLNVLSYSDLSNAKSTDLLTRLNPDLIIADEVHFLKAKSAARTKRFLRYMAAHPQTRFCGYSGTITTRSLKDYAHLCTLALKEGAPVPKDWPTIEEWSQALDPDEFDPTPPKALLELCNTGESVRSGFRRRLTETPGVVATTDAGFGGSLVMSTRPLIVPPDVEAKIQLIRKDWVRPDGELLVDSLQVAHCIHQMACGFFYRWRWPRGESPVVIAKWLAARKDWKKEVREKLKRAEPHLDSPLLLWRAAQRFYHPPEPSTPEDKLPKWKAESWPSWVEVKDTAHPETEAVWVDDFMLRDVETWVKENPPGIIWYEFDEVGRELHQRTDLPWYPGGEEASTRILEEKGDRSIIASIHAHGTGKNLQVFSNQLVTTCPTSRWEQLLGRTHRYGQKADEVQCVRYAHTIELQDSLDTAILQSKYVLETLRNQQKLLQARYL